MLSIEAAKLLTRISVLHEVPGRLRLHITGLKKLHGSDELKYDELFLDCIKLIKGIVDLKYCTITGNVLIEYEDSEISSKQIIDLLKLLKNRIFDYFKANQKSTKEKEQVAKDLLDIIKTVAEVKR